MRECLLGLFILLFVGTLTSLTDAEPCRAPITIDHGSVFFQKEKKTEHCLEHVKCDQGFEPTHADSQIICARIQNDESTGDDYGSYYEYNYDEEDDERESSGEDEDYEYDRGSEDNETQILYQNYEILSNFYKKYYVDLRVIDTSCTPESHPPPSLDHGFVEAFQTRQNVLLPSKNYNVLLYACEEGYKLSSESTGELFCQENGWIGVHPSCEETGETVPTTTTTHECSDCLSNDCGEGFELFGGECVDVDECERDNGGCEESCVNLPGAFECQCPQGYIVQGTECLDDNECLSNNGHGPCHDACTNSEGSYSCSCDNIPGTILGEDGQSCIPSNDLCEDDNNGCSHECVSSQDQAFCLCPEGYKLDSDWKNCIILEEPPVSTPPPECTHPGFEYSESEGLCVDINECSKSPCGPHGLCTNTNGSYVCECPEGFSLKDNDCLDVDECAWADCGSGGSCFNTEGSYRCDCYAGYVSDASSICVDADECAGEDNPCGSVEHVCRNTEGSYECLCSPGLTPVGNTCEDIDECSNGTLHSCSQACTNSFGGYECGCSGGYVLSGPHDCLDVDECAKGEHVCEQICVNEIGTYSCDCHPGFEPSDSHSCIPSCNSHNCKYSCVNGTCSTAEEQQPPGCNGSVLQSSNVLYNCSTDQIFDTETVCVSDCNYGELITAICNHNGSWERHSQSCGPLGCPPLKPYFSSVIIQPLDCSREPQMPSRVCSASCPPGTELIGSGSIVCEENRLWAYPDGEPNCLPKEKEEPVMEGPFIRCPDSIRANIHADRGKAHVILPVLETNVDWGQDVFAEPVWGKALNYELPPGSHTIRFSAHKAGYNPDVCFINITVVDVTPPKVYRCPESFSISSQNKKVYWNEPLFGDNVRVAHIVTNRLPGSKLPLGTHTIIYEAGDHQGNRIRCSFEVKVFRKKRFRKREWVLCRIGSMGRQIKLLLSHVPNGCRRLPD